MTHHRLATPDIDRIFRGETVSGLSEWQLLERYLERRDEIAFEALVARHGPMVLAVCRRMLRDPSDIDDAFQATFLVLVRRARQLGPRDAIGPWLHGVAARVALRARSEAARRRRLLPIPGEIPAAALALALVDGELGEVLDQELSRLPSKYRSPVVLCYLEGRTHEEAARQLAWPIGTVKGRLSRARDLLRSRLARRGLAPTATALTLVLARDSSAALHRELLDRTVKSSLRLAMGQTTAQVVSTSISSLVEGVLTSMMFTKLKWAGAAVIVSGIALTGAAAMARHDGNQQGNDPQVAVNRAEISPGLATEPAGERSVEPDRAAKAPGREQAPSIADLRSQLLHAARLEWTAALNDFLKFPEGLERAYQASRRLKTAEEENLDGSSEKTYTTKAHFDRIREIARIQRQRNRSATEVQSAQLKSFVAEAELGLALASSIAPEEPKSPEAAADPQPPAKPDQNAPRRRFRAGSAGDAQEDQDPQSQQILIKLRNRIAMSFHEETPLGDVLKYIKQATSSPELKNGIPIYVDPIGLQEAERSMTSTVRNLDLEGVPLYRTLQLALRQLGLVYFVQDGMLVITSAESEDQRLPEPTSGPSPLMQSIEQAQKGELTVSEMKELIEKMKLAGQIERLQNPPSGAGGFGGESGPKPNFGGEPAERDHELVDLLLKETRELLDLLKAEKQNRKASEPAAKSQK